MTGQEMGTIVQHQQYHASCFGFWHVASARGLDYMRWLDCGEMADIITKVVRLPQGRAFETC